MVLYRQIEWSLFSCIGLVRTICLQHHGLFSPTLFMRPWTTLSVYTTSWSLLTNPIHETRDHSICLYNIMVSSHQSHTWDQGPLCLSMQHHGLFSPIPYMRPGTTLSVYTTPWFLLTNPIQENRDHSICLYNTMVSSWSLVSCMEWDWWEEIMMLHRQIEWSMVSWIGLVRRDHGVV
jgi:hypothetical protein